MPRGRGRFSVVAPVLTDPSGHSVRFGMIDESGKLNLNSILGWGLSDTANRNLLMNLPYMTYDVADAILDWLDTDDTPRQYGTESDYYMSLPQPYHAANGPLASLDELLMVKGVTPALLYGEDLNRNGIMDAGEDINGDGYFDRGWSAYLTVYSNERNLQADGTARINVNQQSLPNLFDQISGAFGETAATFVVAYRMNGPAQSGGSGNSGGSGSKGGSGSSGGSSGGSSSGGKGGSGGGGGGSSSSGGSSSGSGGGSSSSSSTNQTVQLGGLNIPMPPKTGKTTLTSIYQLLGASVTATVNGKKTTLTSPWASSSQSVSENMPNLLDKLTLVDDLFIPGRINVNLAPYEVLMGLPGMTDTLATQIVGAQNGAETSGSSGSTQSTRSTNAWLVIEGLTKVAQMIQFDPFLSAHGDVYRVQSVGFFDEGGPVVRLEAVIDSSVPPARIINFRDLTELGRGFTRQQLGVP